MFKIVSYNSHRSLNSSNSNTALIYEGFSTTLTTYIRQETMHDLIKQQCVMTSERNKKLRCCKWC